MQNELKDLLEQASASELIEAQTLISTLLRGHSVTKSEKVQPVVRRKTSNTSSHEVLHISEEFVAKALVSIFHKVFGWSDISHKALRSHQQFENTYRGVTNCFLNLKLDHALFYPVLLETCEIIKRKQDGSPTDLSSYKVLGKIANIQEVLYRAHPAAQYIKGYFSCLQKAEGVDN